MPFIYGKKEIREEAAENDQKIYEVGFHIVPTVAEDDLGVRVTAIRDVIEAHGGKLIADEYPKHMELSYSMVKVASNKRATYHSSYFGWMKFEAEPKGAVLIEKAMQKDDFILRFVLVKTVRENTMAPKKALQRRSDDETPKAEEKVEVKPVLTEEELDKTIEDLVIS